MAINFNCDTRVVFAGEGMTPGGAADAEGVASGYVRCVRDFIRAQHPPTAPIVIDRCGRGRIADLAARWNQDVIAQRPDILTVHFDVGALSTPPDQVSSDQYFAVFRQLLVQAKEFLPTCRLIFCQPAALWSKAAVQADDRLRPYVQAVYKLNAEFDGEVIVPLHEALLYARRIRPDIQWFTDQSALTPSGHMLVAHTWMESCGIVRRAFA